MKWFILFIALLFISDDIVIFDKNNNSKSWYITNDNVMGGVSNSSMIVNKNGNAIFSGKVSTDNNGGFAMTRLPLDIKLNNNTKIVLKLKGDSKKYQLRIKSKRFQRYWYVQSFNTSGKTEKIELKLTDFYPFFRGYKLNLSNFKEDTIKEIAILIGNKKDETFSLEIESITIK